jgi:hypothetical protein
MCGASGRYRLRGRKCRGTETSSKSREMNLNELTSLPAGSPARTFRTPVGALELMGAALGFGSTTFDSFAYYDPVSCSWKTSQVLLLGDATELDEFSGTWPRSGLMRNGMLRALTSSMGQVSTENASGYWHTPTTRDFKGQSGRGNRERRGKNGRLHIANLCDQIVDYGRQDLVRSATFREWLMGLPIGHTDLRR